MLLGKKGCQLLEVPPARENPEFPCFPGKALCAYDVQIFQSCFPRDNWEVEVEYRVKAGQKAGDQRIIFYVWGGRLKNWGRYAKIALQW